MRLFLYVYFLVLFISTSHLFAQRTYSFSVGLTGAYYDGDLTDRLNNALILPGVTASGSLYLTPTISVRLGLSLGTIGAADSLANDPSRQVRNLSFQSTLGELSSIAVWYIRRDKRFGVSWMNKPHISPYLLGGIAVFGHDPRAYWDGNMHRLQPLGTEGQFSENSDAPNPYRLAQIAIPFGGGISARIGKRWGIRLELGYRMTFTDYLDDVSTVYPAPEDLLQSKGVTAVNLSNRSQGALATGSQRGNPAANDSYIFSSFAFVYFLDRFR